MSNKAMRKTLPGDLNAIARNRCEKTSVLNHPNFAALERGTRKIAGRIVRKAAGITTYTYG